MRRLFSDLDPGHVLLVIVLVVLASANLLG